MLLMSGCLCMQVGTVGFFGMTAFSLDRSLCKREAPPEVLMHFC